MQMSNTTEQAMRLLRLGQLEEADRISQLALEHESDLNGDGIWTFLFIRAEVLRVRGQAAQALKYLEAQRTPDRAYPEFCARFRMHCGYYQGLLGRYEASHRLLNDAQHKAIDLSHDELHCEVLFRRGFVFYLQENYTESEKLYREALRLSTQLPDWYFRGHALWGVGKNFMIREQYEEALTWLKEALTVFESPEARLSMAMVWSEMAVCYLGLGEDEKAMDLFQKSRQIDEERGAVHNYQVTIANIGNVYLHRRNYLTAIAHYRQALSLAREIEDPVSIKKWSYNIRLTYARLRQDIDQQVSIA